MGVFGGGGVGKRVVMKELMNKIGKKENGLWVFGGVGEGRGEGKELVREMIE